MKNKLLVLGVLFTSFSQLVYSQFTLEGEFRPRTELFGNGFNYRYQPATATPAGNLSGREGTTAYLGTSVRAALKAKYATETYQVYMSVQEVFQFGDRRQISAAGNGNFRVQEAWVDIRLSDKWRFKFGRQPLSYDDQRILGGLAWAQQARTHDVGILKFKDSGFSLDAGYSLNTNGGNVFNTAALFTYRELAFIHANKKFGNVSLSALLLGNVFQDGTENKAGLFTGGIHAKGSFGKFGLSANAYLQDGDRVSGVNDIPVEGAYLLGLDATYKVSDKVTILAGGEIISGAGDNGPGFFPLYGTNHKFNGLMDRFYVGNHAIGRGLVDLNLGAKFKLGKGYNLTLKGHNFTEESGAGNSLGQEVDLVLAKGFKGFKLVAGYSQFFESDDFPNPAGNPEAKSFQNWAWAMLVFKPKFLNGAK